MSTTERLKSVAMSALMPLLPKEDLSHWVGQIAHLELPEPMRLSSMKAFVKAYNINMEEAEYPIERYRSVGDLFTRKLKEGARPIGEGLVHPCDSKVAAAGEIRAEMLSQVKGIEYSTSTLMGDVAMSRHFEKGVFATYYLCPTDYHRVHVPLTAKCEWIQHIPGAFWPVNSWSVRKVDQLYAINERVAMVFRTSDDEYFALVLVAATNVGNIKIAFDRTVSTARAETGARAGQRPRNPRAHHYAQGVSGEPELAKGDEVGLFSMGSSVVFLADAALSKRYGLTQETMSKLVGKSVQVGQTVSKSHV